MNVAIIPARGGSRRIPRKNIRPFHGKPIIAYSIDAARESGLFDRVFVSTDDEEIALVADSCGAIGVKRPAALAVDAVGTQDVARHLLEILTQPYNLGPIDHACCIYATVPLLTPADLLAGYHELRQRAPDFVYVEGWYYFGTAAAFLESRSLDGPDTLRVEVPERWIDINVEEDWQRAERMYQALHEVPHATH